MAVLVYWVLVGGSIKIPAYHVIYKTIALIVYPIAGDLSGIDPDVIFQIFMINVIAGIQDGEHDLITIGGIASGGEIPDFRSANDGQPPL